MAENIDIPDGWYNGIPTVCGMVTVNGRSLFAIELAIQVPGHAEPIYRTKFDNDDSDIGLSIEVGDALLLGCKGDVPVDWKLDESLWNDRSEPLRVLLHTDEGYKQQVKTLAKSKPFEHTPGYLVKKYEMSAAEKAQHSVGIADRVKLMKVKNAQFLADKAAGNGTTGPARAPAPRGAPAGNASSGNDEIPPDDFGGGDGDGGGGGDDDIPFGPNNDLNW